MATQNKLGADYRIDDNVLFYQGTNTLIEWFLHLLVFPMPHGSGRGRVHSSWYLFYLMTGARAIHQLADNCFSTNRPAVITGFSMGGAIAVYAAIAFKRLYPTIPLKVILWAPARPGDREFVDYYNSLEIPTTIIRVGNDPVPSLPPFGYCAVDGTRIRMASDTPFGLFSDHGSPTYWDQIRYTRSAYGELPPTE